MPLSCESYPLLADSYQKAVEILFPQIVFLPSKMIKFQICFNVLFSGKRLSL